MEMEGEKGEKKREREREMQELKINKVWQFIEIVLL
jgi:hypothetical protein